MSVRIQFTAIRANTRVGLVPANMADQLHDYTKKAADKLVEDVRAYPPIPAGSRYIRTGRLGRAWKVEDISYGRGIHYIVTNSVQDKRSRYYAQGVHGPTRQWAVHSSHGWKNIGDVRNAQGGLRAFQVGAQKIINRNLGKR